MKKRVAAAKAENCKRAASRSARSKAACAHGACQREGRARGLDDKMRAEEMKRARDLANADCR